MDDIAALLTEATTLWAAVAVLSVTVVGFLIGRKLIKKVGG